MKAPAWFQSQNGQRILFAGFNLAALIVACFVSVTLWAIVDDQDHEIEQKQQMLVRLEAILAREGDVRTASDRVSSQLSEGEFLKGANEGVIAAELQIRLKGIAERNGARVLTMQGLTQPSDDTLRFIGAKIGIVGTHQQLQRTVYEIETGKPYLFVRNASIKLAPAAGPVTAEPVLEAHFDIAGAMPKAGQP